MAATGTYHRSAGTFTAEQPDPSLLNATVEAGTNWAASGLAKEAGGNLAAIAAKDFATQTTLAALNAKIPAIGPQAAAASLSVTQLDYYTPVLVHTGGGVYNVTTLAAGGAGSDYWDLAANAVYELRCDPDWTGGYVDSDTVRGVFKLGGAPADDNDGNYIRTGERARICTTAITTVYVRAHNIGKAGVWKLHRKDA